MVDNAHGDPRMNGGNGGNNRRITGDPRMVNVPVFPRNNQRPNANINAGMADKPVNHPNAVPSNGNVGMNGNHAAGNMPNRPVSNNVGNGFRNNTIPRVPTNAGNSNVNNGSSHAGVNAGNHAVNGNASYSNSNNGFNRVPSNDGPVNSPFANNGSSVNARVNNGGSVNGGLKPRVPDGGGVNGSVSHGSSLRGAENVRGAVSNGLHGSSHIAGNNNNVVNGSVDVRNGVSGVHAGSGNDGRQIGNANIVGSRSVGSNENNNGSNGITGIRGAGVNADARVSLHSHTGVSDKADKSITGGSHGGSVVNDGDNVVNDDGGVNRRGDGDGKARVSLKPLSRVRVGGVDEDSAEARRLRRMVEDDDELGDGGVSHGSKRGSYVDDGEHGVGTGRRGADRFRRDRRVSQGVVLDEKRVRRLDDLNRRARLRKGVESDDVSSCEDFVLQEADVRVLDYLVKWRFSTIRDIGRVAGWSESYLKTHRRLNAYIDVGLLTADRVPLENYRYVQLTPDGVFFSDYSFMGKEDVLDFLRSYRGHAFGLSSLASHLLNRMRNADEVERDLLGVGEDEYAEIRREIRDGVSRVVSEREFRSSWQSIRTGAGRSPASLTDARFRHAMEKEYMDAHEVKGNPGSPLSRQTFELYCNNPEYKGSMAWLWVVYGNDVIQSTGNNGIRRIPVDNVAVDDSGRPIIVKERGDLFSTRDHCPDLVIARPRDRVTGRPRSIAVELELTAKTEDEYMRTMCAYTGTCGKLLYGKVVWQVVNAALGNLIRRGAVKAGAVEGRDFVIVPVYSEDVRGSFARGVDMQPGTWKDADEPRGYTVLKTLMDEGIDAEL